MSYSPDGRTLASAGKDGVIRFWDALTLRPQKELRGGQGEINEVAYAPDGKSLASAGDDGTVWLWDLTSARQRAILRPEGNRTELSTVAISPDGKVLAAGGKAGKVWSWDFGSNRLQASRNPLADWILSLAFAPDSRLLAAATREAGALLLDPATLRDRGQLQHPYGQANCLSFSHDGKTLAAGYGWGGRILLWNLTTRTQAHNWSGHQSSFIQSLSFSPHDTLLVSVGDDGLVRLWDTRSEDLRASEREHTGRIWCTAFALDGKRLATASQDGAIKLWHVLDDDNRRMIRVDSEKEKWVAIDWIAFSPEGQTLFTRTWSGERGCWNTFSGRRAEPWGRPATSIIRPALVPGSRLATVADDKRELRVQDLSGAAVRLYRHGQPISAVAISPDGVRVAFADNSPRCGCGRLVPASPGSYRDCLASANAWPSRRMAGALRWRPPLRSSSLTPPKGSLSRS